MTSRRNIGILAHIDAGKTTVTEHLLHLGGVIRRPGAVDAGTTITDWMLEEQERGITISGATVTFEWRDTEVTVIDTPGHVDFTIEVERALRVLDGAVLVVSGPDGVQAQTETVWHQAERRRLPIIGFVNKLDRPGFEQQRVLDELRERLGATPVPLQLPVAITETSLDLVDVISGQRFHHAFAGRDQRPIDPVEVAMTDEDEVLRLEALDVLNDAIASHDDAFAELVLTDRTPTPAHYRTALRAAVHARAILPLIWGAARMGVGLGALADVIVDLLPEPQPTDAFTRDGQRRVTDADPSAAFVFKTEHRKQGTLAYTRVFSGRLTAGALVRSPDGQMLGIPTIARVLGQEIEPLDRLEAGQVGALLFTDPPIPYTGDTIGPQLVPFTFEKIRPPDAVIELAVEAPDPDSHEQMLRALRALTVDDPSLRLGTDRETGAAVLAGMGELHLEIAIQRAARASGLELKAGKPKARTRWLLINEASGEAEVPHPTGRARVRVAITLRPEPNPGPPIVQASIERDEWRDALLAGIEVALGHDGYSARHVLDAQVVVTDVEPHGGEVIAPFMFRDAATWATDLALQGGGLEEAEPWGALVVTVPDASVGRVVGDLARRRTRIKKTESRGTIQELTAEAPLGELIGYATHLRNVTAGRAVFTVEPIGYRARKDD